MIRGFLGHRRYFSAEAGGTSGTPDPTPPPVPPAGRTYTDAELDALVKQRIETALADERKKTADAQATEQGKFKELAEQRQGELTQRTTELETTKKQAQAYEQILQAQLDERLKALPKELQALVIGDSLTTRMDALVKAESAAKALAAQPKAPGTPQGPANGGGSTRVPTTPDDLETKRRAGGYHSI